jgi:hypothetical protein
MTAARKPQDPAKFARYRERMKARGLKEVRLWVQDPDAPGFRERLAADIARINASQEAGEVERWLDLAAAEVEAMIQAEERGHKSRR